MSTQGNIVRNSPISKVKMARHTRNRRVDRRGPPVCDTPIGESSGVGWGAGSGVKDMRIIRLADSLVPGSDSPSTAGNRG